jgi:hypothetical protein
MKGFVKMQEDFRKMNNAVGDLDNFNAMARSLERSEVRRAGTGVLQARVDIARRLGIGPDAIENFRSLRAKMVPHWLMNRVRAELVSALHVEMQNLEHEIQLHRQAGTHHTDDALASAETQVAAARAILRGEVK